MHNQPYHGYTNRRFLKRLSIATPAVTAWLFGLYLLAGFQAYFSYSLLFLLSLGGAVGFAVVLTLYLRFVRWGSGFEDGKAEVVYENEEARRAVEWRVKQVQRFFYSLALASLPLVASIRDSLVEQYTYWSFLGASLVLGVLTWWALGFYFRRQQRREDRQAYSNG